MTIDIDTTTAPTVDASPSTREHVSTGVEPIIAGFFPDPSICRVGADYYLVNSSFEYSPGVPLWHSTDLLSWTQVGNILERNDQFAAGSARANGGIYAPTLRHHNDRFWLITTDVSSPTRGQLVVSAPAAEGPWTAARTIEGLAGIDPDLAWDLDGTCYVTFCSTDPALPGIAQARVDLEAGVALEAPRIIFDGTGLAFPEGPHLYSHNGWWYLLIAEGGTERGHAVTIARSPTPHGPFEAAPHNPILSHRSTYKAVQNTGHADLVNTKDGKWALVYLGVRSRGTTPWYHVNGRETFLAGVEWVDEWPIVVEDEFSAPPPEYTFADDFSSTELHPRWISPGASPTAIATLSGTEGVLIASTTADNGAISSLAVRARDSYWRFEADVDTSGTPAVRIRMDEQHWFEIGVAENTVYTTLTIGPISNTQVHPEVVVAESLRLHVAARRATHNGPDDIELGVATAEEYTQLRRVDGRYLSTEVAGGFTGRTIALHSLSGTSRVIRVDYRPLQE